MGSWIGAITAIGNTDDTDKVKNVSHNFRDAIAGIFSAISPNRDKSLDTFDTGKLNNAADIAVTGTTVTP